MARSPSGSNGQQTRVLKFLLLLLLYFTAVVHHSLSLSPSPRLCPGHVRPTSQHPPHTCWHTLRDISGICPLRSILGNSPPINASSHRAAFRACLHLAPVLFPTVPFLSPVFQTDTTTSLHHLLTSGLFLISGSLAHRCCECFLGQPVPAPPCPPPHTHWHELIFFLLL